MLRGLLSDINLSQWLFPSSLKQPSRPPASVIVQPAVKTQTVQEQTVI